MDFQTSALILAWVAILVLALAMAGLLRQVHTLSTGRGTHSQIGPPIGTVAPPLSTDLQDQWDTTTVLLFVDVTCNVCQQRLERAEDLAQANTDRLRFLAIYPAGADGHRHRHVQVVEHAHEAFSRYRIPVTPFGIVVDSTGLIVRAAPLGSEVSLSQLTDEALTGR